MNNSVPYIRLPRHNDINHTGRPLRWITRSFVRSFVRPSHTFQSVFRPSPFSLSHLNGAYEGREREGSNEDCVMMLKGNFRARRRKFPSWQAGSQVRPRKGASSTLFTCKAHETISKVCCHKIQLERNSNYFTQFCINSTGKKEIKEGEKKKNENVKTMFSPL